MLLIRSCPLLLTILPLSYRYNFMGSCASAAGALAAGFATTALIEQYGLLELDSYRLVFVQYAALAVVLMLLTCMLSKEVECVGKGAPSRGDQGGDSLSPFLSRTARAESMRHTASSRPSEDDQELLTRPLLLTMGDEEAQGEGGSERFGGPDRAHDAPSLLPTLSGDTHIPAASYISGGASLPSGSLPLLMTTAMLAGPSLQGSHLCQTTGPHLWPTSAPETPEAAATLLIHTSEACSTGVAALGYEARHAESGGYNKPHSAESSPSWSSHPDGDRRITFSAAAGEGSAAGGRAAGGGGAGGGGGEGAAGGGAGAFRVLGLSPKSLRIVAHLSFLIATDSFGSAMITGTLLAYYFKVCPVRVVVYLGLSSMQCTCEQKGYAGVDQQY